MSTPAVRTIVRMIESLPEHEQDRVVDHLREFILDLEDELQWDRQFNETKHRLNDTARGVREQISGGNARPLGPKDL